MTIHRPPLRALTLWPEWAWAIMCLDKRVENRPRRFPQHLLGERIVIHAGRHIGGSPARWARQEGLDALIDSAFHMGWDLRVLPTEYGDGSVGIQATKAYGAYAEAIGPIVCSALVGTARVVECIEDDTRRWAVPGCWHWILEDVVRFADPIGGVGGALGLWPLQEFLCKQVEEAA